MGMVERHLVQRGQNALERLPFTHRRAFAWSTLGRQEPSHYSHMLRCNPSHRCGRGPAAGGADIAQRVWRWRDSAYPPHWGDLAVFSGNISETWGKPDEVSARPRPLPLSTPTTPDVPASVSANRTGSACRERPCLANMCFTGEPSVLSLPPMAALPQALTVDRRRIGAPINTLTRQPHNLRRPLSIQNPLSRSLLQGSFSRRKVKPKMKTRRKYGARKPLTKKPLISPMLGTRVNAQLAYISSIVHQCRREQTRREPLRGL